MAQLGMNPSSGKYYRNNNNSQIVEIAKKVVTENVCTMITLTILHSLILVLQYSSLELSSKLHLVFYDFVADDNQILLR